MITCIGLSLMLQNAINFENYLLYVNLLANSGIHWQFIFGILQLSDISWNSRILSYNLLGNLFACPGYHDDVLPVTFRGVLVLDRRRVDVPREYTYIFFLVFNPGKIGFTSLTFEAKG